MAPFEVDIETGAEVRLSQRAFGDGVICYRPDNQGWFVAASDPMRIRGYFEDGDIDWERPSFLAELASQDNPYAGFALDRGAEIPDPPVSIIPEPLMRAQPTPGPDARLVGADGAGRILVEYVRPNIRFENNSLPSIALVDQGRIAASVMSDSMHIRQGAVSHDGRTIVAVRTGWLEGGDWVHYMINGRFALVIARNAGESLSLLDLETVQFDEAAHPLRAAANSEMRS